MEKARIAVLVSGGGTNLGALIEAASRGKLKSGEIALVISSKKGAYALQRARKAGVPSALVERDDCSSCVEFERGIIDLLEKNRIDLIILAGFMCILSADFTSRYPERIINVHPSLIPSFCGKGYYGLRVHEAALDYGVKITGATVHFVNEIPDGGRIILQRAVDVREEDTPDSLQRRVMEEAEWIILPEAAEMVSAEIIRQKTKKGIK